MRGEVAAVGRRSSPEHVFASGGTDEVYEFDPLNSVSLALTPWRDERELSEGLGSASRVAVL